MLEQDRFSLGDGSAGAASASPAAVSVTRFSAPSPSGLLVAWKSNSKSDRSPPLAGALAATLFSNSPAPGATGASMNSTGFTLGHSFPLTILAAAILWLFFFFLPAASRVGKQL